MVRGIVDVDLPTASGHGKQRAVPGELHVRDPCLGVADLCEGMIFSWCPADKDGEIDTCRSIQLAFICSFVNFSSVRFISYHVFFRASLFGTSNYVRRLQVLEQQQQQQ